MSITDSSQDLSGLTIDSMESSEVSGPGLPAMSATAFRLSEPILDDSGEMNLSGDFQEDIQALQDLIELEEQKSDLAKARSRLLRTQMKVQRNKAKKATPTPSESNEHQDMPALPARPTRRACTSSAP